MVVRVRAVSLLGIVAALSGCGATASPPTVTVAPPPSVVPSLPPPPSAPPTGSPEPVVRAFWRAMHAGSVARVRAVVALPIAWGSGCGTLLDEATLNKTLAEDLSGGTPTEQEPDTVRRVTDELGSYDEDLAAPYERLTNAPGACPKLPPSADAALRARRHAIYLVDGILTRVSWVEGAWRVTGWAGQTRF